MRHASGHSRGRLLLPLLLCLLLSGCEAPLRYGTATLTVAGGRAYLAVQQRRLPGDEPRFDLFTSADPDRRNWTAPERFFGRPVGAAPGPEGEAALLVFDTGAVQAVRVREGALQAEPYADARRPLVAAAGTAGALYGLSRDGEGLQVHRLVDGAWQAAGPVFTPPAGVESPALAVSTTEVLLLWTDPAVRRAGQPEGVPALRAVRLGDTAWEPLPAPPAPHPAVALLRGDELCVAALRTPAAPLAPVRLALWRWRGEAWSAARTVALPEPLLAAPSLALAGCRDGEKLLLAVTGGPAAYALPVEPGAVAEARASLVSGTEAPPLVPQSAWLFLMLAFFLTTGILHVLLQRRRLARRDRVAAAVGRAGAAPRGEAPVAAAEQAPDGQHVFAVGGVATPMERVLALVIDYGLLFPFFIAFLWADGVALTSVAADPELLARSLPAYLAFNFVFILYAAAGEAITGQTLGKHLLGLRVRALQGGRPAAGKVGVRNLLRPVDTLALPLASFPLPCFPALLSILFSRYNQRLGDRLAGTVVVRRVPIARRRLVLASTSPRRRECLLQMGLAFRTVDPAVDESAPLRRTPEETAVALAQRKAEAVGERLADGEIVIGADTLVALDDEIIGKPRDREDARRILARLAGRSHRVITGLAVWDRATNRRVSAFETTEVRFAPLSDEEIDAYVASGEADDKAGAYAIQGEGGRFVRSLSGSYENVVGLPVQLLRFILDEMET
jgi:septum formation protein